MVEAVIPTPQENRGDTINHPPHYTFGKIEVITAIEDWGLGYHLGNAIKYIARAGLKGSPIEDLKKARWYLDRAIDKLAKGDQIADLRTVKR